MIHCVPGWRLGSQSYEEFWILHISFIQPETKFSVRYLVPREDLVPRRNNYEYLFWISTGTLVPEPRTKKTGCGYARQEYSSRSLEGLEGSSSSLPSTGISKCLIETWCRWIWTWQKYGEEGLRHRTSQDRLEIRLMWKRDGLDEILWCHPSFEAKGINWNKR